MPVSNELKKDHIDDDGVTRDALAFYFTNGAKDQIQELREFFKQETDLELIKLAISVLQKIKETNEAKRGAGTTS